jgi:hypothetical protein
MSVFHHVPSITATHERRLALLRSRGAALKAELDSVKEAREVEARSLRDALGARLAQERAAWDSHHREKLAQVRRQCRLLRGGGGRGGGGLSAFPLVGAGEEERALRCAPPVTHNLCLNSTPIPRCSFRSSRHEERPNSHHGRHPAPMPPPSLIPAWQLERELRAEYEEEIAELTRALGKAKDAMDTMSRDKAAASEEAASTQEYCNQLLARLSTLESAHAAARAELEAAKVRAT